MMESSTQKKNITYAAYALVHLQVDLNPSKPQELQHPRIGR